MDTQQLETINKNMRVMIAIQLKSLDKGGKELSLREQIGLLNDLGVRPVDIAGILNRKPRFINKELSFIKKPKAEKE